MTNEILNRKVKIFPVGKEYYVMYEGELTKVTIVCTRYDVNEDKSRCVVKLPNGKHHVLLASEPMYRTTTDYEEGSSDSFGMAVLNHYLPFKNGSYWIFENGEPVEVKPCPDLIVIYNCTKETLVDGKPMPETWYRTREDCIKWNDYTIVEADGSKRVQKSKLRRLMLNDEQRGLVETLKKAFEALKSAGALVVYDQDCCGFDVYNINDVEDWKFTDDVQEDVLEKTDGVAVYDSEPYYTAISLNSGHFQVPCYEDAFVVTKWKED